MTGFQIKQTTKHNKMTYLFQMVAVYFALLSMAVVGFSAFKVHVSYVQLIFLLMPIALGSELMACISKYRILRMVLFVLAWGGLLFWQRDDVEKGIDMMVRVYARLSESNGNYESIGQFTVEPSFFRMMLWIGVLLAVLLAMILVGRRLLWLAVAVMMTPVILVACASYLPSVKSVGFLLVAIVFYLMCFYKSDDRAAVVTLIAAMTALVTMLVVTMICLPKVEGYKETNEVAYKAVRTSLKRWNALGLDGILNEIIESRGNYTKGGVGKGDLSNLSNARTSGSKELEVVLTKKPTSPVYLKAFVGTTYTGTSWETMDDAAWEKMDKFARRANVWQALMNMTYDKIVQINRLERRERGGAGFESRRMNIQVLNGEDDIGYVPYNGDVNETRGLVPDLYMTGAQRDAYSYDYFESQDVETLQMAGFLTEEFLTQSEMEALHAQTDLWKSYRAFAYETYLDVPENMTGFAKFVDAFLQRTPAFMDTSSSRTSVDAASAKKGKAVLSKTEREYLTMDMQAMFQKNFSYTRTPGAKSADKDFVEYFIENGKGFCVHFATMATLTYRRYGVPARYVEGYAIPVSAFKKQSNGYYKAVVTDEMAHAWTEILDDDMGWMMQEHTLSYDVAGDVYEPRENTDNQASNRPTPQTTQQAETRQETTTPKATQQSEETDTAKSGIATGQSGGRTLHPGKFLRGIGYILVAVVILVGAAWLQSNIRIRRKALLFRRRRHNAGVRAMYEEIYQVCRCRGLQTTAKTEEQSFLDMQAQFHALNAEEWQWIYDCALRAVFTGHVADRSERKRMYELMMKLKKSEWAQLKLFQKMQWKLIWAL